MTSASVPLCETGNPEIASFHFNAAFSDFNRSLLDVFNLVDSQLILMLLWHAINLVVSWAKFRVVRNFLS